MPDDTPPTSNSAAEDDDLDDLDDDDVPAGRQRTIRPPGPIDRRIANHIRALREAKGWSIEDLADQIQPRAVGEVWNKSRMTRVENAKKRITVTELDDILRALGANPSAFYQDAGIVQIPTSTEEWIRADPTISDRTRETLLDVYSAGQLRHGTNRDRN